MSRERACRVCRQKHCTCAGIGNCANCGRKFTNRAQFRRDGDRRMVCKTGAPCAIGVTRGHEQYRGFAQIAAPPDPAKWTAEGAAYSSTARVRPSATSKKPG